MYDHIGLKVGDLDASVRFYTAALAPLGYAPAGAHVAFRAPDHSAIRKFHADGLKAGGRDNGGAGPRADYSPSYFAAFLIDPDGNNVEAVCT